MPPVSNIKLGSGSIYFKGLNESFEAHDIETGDGIEWADDKQYIRKFDSTSITLTVNDVQMPREWTLAECKYCGYKFPVTTFYTMVFGTKNWTCPRCLHAYQKSLEDVQYRYGVY